jgi:recombination DNA repair RAD52 pathway protein
MFTEEQIAQLTAPLNRSHVKKNPKGFDYVEGWHAIAEANRIFGFGGWDRETMEMHLLGEPEQVNANWRVAYRARVRITVWGQEGRKIVRDGAGYGSGIVKDLRDAHEGAIKEAETDAMKRALMTFGNPFGLALYDKQQSQVVNLPKPISQVADTFIGALRMAQTLDDLTEWLDKMKPELAKLAEPDKAAIRESYAAHRTQLAEAEYKEAAE